MYRVVVNQGAPLFHGGQSLYSRISRSEEPRVNRRRRQTRRFVSDAQGWFQRQLVI